jgi:hypothetical protein
MAPPSFPARLPAGVSFEAVSVASAEPSDEPVIDFTPVPRLRNRRTGWTEARQRAFIAALARCGSVKTAAAHVGMSARTAYRLTDAPGADSFAAAWDQALDIGLARIQSDALERALNGAFVPIYRRGRLVRVEHRRCDRLAIALMAGKDRDVLDYKRAVDRRRYHEELRAADERRAAEERERAEWQAAYDAELEAMVERGNQLMRERRRPRVRML